MRNRGVVLPSIIMEFCFLIAGENWRKLHLGDLELPIGIAISAGRVYWDIIWDIKFLTKAMLDCKC